MKQILNNISRITLSIMREGRGVGLLLITLLMMAMSPQNVWADDCDDCNGTGKTCVDCNGTGKETCGDCRGSGKETCEDCWGSGKETCVDCWGSGKEYCEDCQGSGNKSTCEDCCGSGKDDYGKSCPKCGGDGLFCLDCYGSGYTENSCSTCKGSGKSSCSACNGSGGPTCSKCDGSGESSCSTCNGSGGPTCSACNGSGKVAHEHQSLTVHSAVAATCTTVGNSAYWSCSVCGKYFSDAEGKNVIEEDSWVKPAVHNFANGTCTKCGAAAPQFTYKATSDLSSTFQTAFGSYGTVTCGTWTDANTPVTVIVNGTVTSIPMYAFSDKTNLTSITIPEGVTSICKSAFIRCTNLTSVIIPNSMTSIGINAFKSCSNLASIIIPNSVTSIGEDAFGYCTAFTSITIPNSVTSIGNYAFEFCENLTSITIPNSVTSIGKNAFQSCTSLTSIAIPSGVSSIEERTFFNCKELASITVQSSNATLGSQAFNLCDKLQTIYVPENCVATYKAATNWSDYATKIKAIPPTVPFDLAITKAGATEATLSKESVKTITINKSAAGAPQVKAQSGTEVVTPTQLEHNTRYDFTITKVPTLNPGEDDLEGDIIAKAPRRTAAQVQEPTLNGPTLVIGTATAYTTYPLDAEHTDIKVEMAANGNYKINGTEISGTVTSIYFYDPHVFTSETESETYLKSATCTTDAVYYHKCALCDASSEGNTNSTWTKAGSALGHNYANGICTICGTKQTKITYTASEKLPEVTNRWSDGLHTNAFGGYTYTHVFDENTHSGTITFDGEVTSIGDNAFYHCSNLTGITIPSGVTSIGGFAFVGCKNLASITIPSSVASVGNYAFDGCYVVSSNLHNSSSIDLTQYGLTIIDTEQADGLLIKDNCAVECRPGATSLNIPSSVTSIGNYAFYECASLTSITFTTPSSVTSIGDYAFNECSNLTSITIPGGVTSIGEEAFYGCTSLTTVICKGATPATLGNGAFTYVNPENYEEQILPNLNIYVPVGSVDTYKAATNWSDYASIIIERVAPTLYAHVEQEGTKIASLGTAAYDLDEIAEATLAFDNDGNAVMTIGGNTVAKVPAEGSLVMAFTTTMAKADLNKVSKTVSAAGYATLYSPFQLAVPAEGDVEVYAPTYDESAHTLKLNSSTKVNGKVLPVGTGVLLKNAGDATFTITKAAPTYTEASALTGSAVKIANPTKNSAVDGKTVYTLGKETTTEELGFFRYTGDYLNAGLAFLYVNTVDAPSNAKAISLEYDDDETTTSINNEQLIINNEAGAVYNLQGQKLAAPRKGVNIINGKKVLVK